MLCAIADNNMMGFHAYVYPLPECLFLFTTVSGFPPNQLSPHQPSTGSIFVDNLIGLRRGNKAINYILSWFTLFWKKSRKPPLLCPFSCMNVISLLNSKYMSSKPFINAVLSEKSEYTMLTFKTRLSEYTLLEVRALVKLEGTVTGQEA